MVCAHLAALENELLQKSVEVTFRGAAWSKNCREWVYFRCLLDRDSIRQRLNLASCVENHDNDDIRSGLESGLVCTLCNDAIIGLHPFDSKNALIFR